MKRWPTSSRYNNVSLLNYTSLVFVLLTVSACGRMPNLIPDGYGDVFDDKARASTAARVDYPIIVSPNPNDTNARVNNFRVTENGERVWFWEDGYGQRQIPSLLRPPKWYQLNMIYQKDKNLLCSSGWVKPSTKKEVTDVTCNFDVTRYYSKPVLALLIFSMGGDETNPPADDDMSSGLVSRVYYFLPND